ncbi:putative cytochrome P450 [Microthyrium microscopicum]|uniref:Putative cytochrome P450 n=1 Tax=Microthyrium microscopicum TaxID=703497 RepID=A0A6A6U9N1_9PEZI|nr:putative cytochrome P450 [Microthyrium microscopicum]
MDAADRHRIEAAMAFGVLSNSVPTVFWVLLDVFSRPDLLVQLREEIETNAVTIQSRDGKPAHIIDLAAIRDSCPHFVSTFQEVLRLRNLSASTRSVVNDIVLDDQYLLKKGSLVQMPSQYFNVRKAVWGDDAKLFDSKRFLSKEVGTGKTRGFIAFGTTPHICPGRHFASGEVLAIAAMVFLRYDMVAINGWKEPKLSSTALTASITPPKDPYLVSISARDAYKDTTWEFAVTEGKGRFNLIIG